MLSEGGSRRDIEEIRGLARKLAMTFDNNLQYVRKPMVALHMWVTHTHTHNKKHCQVCIVINLVMGANISAWWCLLFPPSGTAYVLPSWHGKKGESSTLMWPSWRFSACSVLSCCHRTRPCCEPLSSHTLPNSLWIARVLRLIKYCLRKKHTLERNASVNSKYWICSL